MEGRDEHFFLALSGSLNQVSYLKSSPLSSVPLVVHSLRRKGRQELVVCVSGCSAPLSIGPKGGRT
jgi:hypothetical protein